MRNNITYKKPIRYEELVDYLAKDKNVIYDRISDVDAADMLLRYNYINVISPFKHHMALRKEGYEFECVKDINNNHIYPYKTDFEEYIMYYELERELYPTYYHGISVFETAYKSVVGHKFLIKYDVVNAKRAEYGFNALQEKVDTLRFHSEGTPEDIQLRRMQMKLSFKKMKKRLYPRDGAIGEIPGMDIYILLDRLSLTEINNIYLCLPSLDQKQIFEKMNDWKLNLGANDEIEFGRKAFNLVSIRNSIMHSNSLTILLKYADSSTKRIRNNSSRSNYEALLNALKFISKNN